MTFLPIDQNFIPRAASSFGKREKERPDDGVAKEKVEGWGIENRDPFIRRGRKGSRSRPLHSGPWRHQEIPRDRLVDILNSGEFKRSLNGCRWKVRGI